MVHHQHFHQKQRRPTRAAHPDQPTRRNVPQRCVAPTTTTDRRRRANARANPRSKTGDDGDDDDVKVLFCGPVLGAYRALSDRLTSLQKSEVGPFDVCLCVGPFRGDRTTKGDDDNDDDDDPTKTRFPLPVYFFDDGVGDEKGGDGEDDASGARRLSRNLYRLRGGADLVSLPHRGDASSRLIVAYVLPSTAVGSSAAARLEAKTRHPSYAGCDVLLASDAADAFAALCRPRYRFAPSGAESSPLVGAISRARRLAPVATTTTRRPCEWLRALRLASTCDARPPGRDRRPTRPPPPRVASPPRTAAGKRKRANDDDDDVDLRRAKSARTLADDNNKEKRNEKGAESSSSATTRRVAPVGRRRLSAADVDFSDRLFLYLPPGTPDGPYERVQTRAAAAIATAGARENAVASLRRTSQCYGFLRFTSHAAAATAVLALTGDPDGGVLRAPPPPGARRENDDDDDFLDDLVRNGDVRLGWALRQPQRSSPRTTSGPKASTRAVSPLDS